MGSTVSGNRAPEPTRSRHDRSGRRNARQSLRPDRSRPGAAGRDVPGAGQHLWALWPGAAGGRRGQCLVRALPHRGPPAADHSRSLQRRGRAAGVSARWDQPDLQCPPRHRDQRSGPRQPHGVERPQPRRRVARGRPHLRPHRAQRPGLHVGVHGHGQGASGSRGRSGRRRDPDLGGGRDRHGARRRVPGPRLRGQGLRHPPPRRPRSAGRLCPGGRDHGLVEVVDRVRCGVPEGHASGAATCTPPG